VISLICFEGSLKGAQCPYVKCNLILGTLLTHVISVPNIVVLAIQCIHIHGCVDWCGERGRSVNSYSAQSRGRAALGFLGLFMQEVLFFWPGCELQGVAV